MLARKGEGRRRSFSYCARADGESQGAVVDLQMDVADGRAERRNALDLMDNNLPGTKRIILGGDILAAAFNLLRIASSRGRLKSP